VGQGTVAALRQDTQVAIVAAQQERDLVTVLAALGVGRQTGFDFVGGDVPMYLDRYDKYGWHFYFNPRSKPQNQPNYDLDYSFQYLSKNGFGMMMPLSLNNIDSTEAVIEYANLAWAIERGRELSIPIFIQAWDIGAPRMLINRYPWKTPNVPHTFHHFPERIRKQASNPRGHSGFADPDLGDKRPAGHGDREPGAPHPAGSREGRRGWEG
jgi:hypothetical protein